MDLDHDGRLDIISGSYWPGHIFVLRGQDDGKYAKPQEIVDLKGEKIHGGKTWVSENDPDMDSLAAAPHVLDWDGDGDLDLIIGNIAGRLILIRGEQTEDGRQVFGTKKEALKADGRVIEVGHGDAGPTSADWDGDGRIDLIVGGGDGSVVFFRNTAEKGEPVYAAGVTLVAANDAVWSKPIPEGTRPTRPGARVKPCVADWNGDGHLDLLVGDFQSMQKPEPQLTEAQKKRRDELEKKLEAAQQKMQAYFEQATKDGREVDTESPEFQELNEEFSALYEELEPLKAGTSTHGFVFVYRRLAPPQD